MNFRRSSVASTLAWSAACLALAGSTAGEDAAVRPASPAVLCAGPDGALCVADLALPGLFRADAKGHVTALTRGSGRHRTPLRAVTSLASGQDGVWFAADRATGEIYKVATGGEALPLSGGAFEIPSGLLYEGRELIVTDLRLGTLSVLPDGGGKPRIVAHVPAPRGLARAPGGGFAVLSMGPDQVVLVEPGGESKPLVKGKPFRFPLAIVRDDPRKRWLVSDGYGRAVWEVSDAGEPQPWIRGAPLVRPSGLALGPAGDVFIADPGAGCLFRATAPDAVRTWPLSP